MKRDGQKPDQLVDVYVDAINQAVAGRPGSLVVGVHVPRQLKASILRGRLRTAAERPFSADVNHFAEYDTFAPAIIRCASAEGEVVPAQSA